MSYRKEIKELTIHTLNNTNLNQLSVLFTEWRKLQGFTISRQQIPEKLMLIVSELAEALEYYRNNDNENFEIEIADVIIRTLDLCGGLKINIDNVIKQKMKYNFTRPYRHGNKLC